MSRLRPCKACGAFRKPEGACPSCGDVHLLTTSRPTAAALLLGLAFVGGCTADDTGDTNETDVVDTDTDGTQAEYGVADTDFADTDDTDGTQAEYGVADTDYADTDNTQADYGVANTDFREAELKKK